MQRPRQANLRIALALAATVAVIAGCGSGAARPTTTAQTTASTATATLPGTGHPPVVIGDKNFTEQFLLGDLYYLALKQQGFSVDLNPNIGPTPVTLQALEGGELNMYPEYLNVWNPDVAGLHQSFKTLRSALHAGQKYAAAHGLELLDPTPFSDTEAIGVTLAYALAHHLRTIGDLRKVATTLTFGAAPEFQQDPTGLPALEQAYGFVPAAFKSLEIGQQYQALDQGAVQAAAVNTTDGELAGPQYTLLRDPLKVLGIGNVVPVVSAHTLAAEGAAFAATINQVSSLLTLTVMRQLNADVDISGMDPQTVARQFLTSSGILPPATG